MRVEQTRGFRSSQAHPPRSVPRQAIAKFCSSSSFPVAVRLSDGELVLDPSNLPASAGGLRRCDACCLRFLDSTRPRPLACIECELRVARHVLQANASVTI